MTFNSVNKDFIKKLVAAIGQENISIDKEILEAYSRDETEDLSYLPDLVVKPHTVEEVSKVLALCNKNLIPVTPIGARTGLSGGALPVFGGVALSLEKFNQILNIDERNFQVTVEPGVITQVLQEAVIEKGLYYPPDPASRGSCFIGGNIAENSGGPKALKYGVVKDYVLNLEVVLTSGEIIWTGANVLKNSTGYNLTQLIVGSEGTLGIVTKIVLKLIPYPRKELLMLVPFRNMEEACVCVNEIFKAGISPSALEFIERDAIDWAMKYVEDINLDIKDDIEAHLLIEVDGNDKELLLKDCEAIANVTSRFNCDEILFAETVAEKNALWKLRRSVAEAVKSNSVYKEEDTVVPRAELPFLLKGVKDIGKAYHFKSVCYGHAGDGNLHVNIIKGDMPDFDWENELPKAIREIFELCKKLGGTISGEHGIGLVQKQYMDVMFSEKQMELMKNIKKVFDPNGIFNPGKIFD